MAKKTRSRKTKYKKRNPVAALLDGLLTLLDTLLEGVAAAAVAILRGIGKLLLLALRGLLWLAKHALLRWRGRLAGFFGCCSASATARIVACG